MTSPAIPIPRRPRGSSTGGQYAPRDNSLPQQALSNEQGRAEQLHAAYRQLWKPLTAKARSNIYADADRLARTSNDRAELAILAKSNSLQVTMSVATNPATPAEVLHILATSTDDLHVRRAALAHPNCDVATVRASGAPVAKVVR